MRKLTTLIAAASVLTVTAQNPIIRDQYTADPTARVFGGKIYLYPSHDIHPPVGQRQDWFCMADYHVFSSENLTDWHDHGVILTQEAVPWGKPDGYSMWAPDCVEKNGTYYFYFPDAPKGGRGFGIGVATAQSPEGPFTCEPQPIKGISGIDPCVLLDDDGSAYIYWGGGGIRGGKLKANMKELDGELKEVRLPRREGQPELPPMQVGGEDMQGLPDGFKEGPFAFKRKGHYYLTFPWVRKEGGTETLAYAMSDRPLGPWTFKGVIMEEHANGCWTNHHSLVEYKGQWYIFYHTNYFSPRDDKRRSACIERVTFNSDGTIQPVKETRRGVGINPATDRIEVDRYSLASDGTSACYIDTTNCQRGSCVVLPKKGSWAVYKDVDFSPLNDAYLIVCARASENTSFTVREANAQGKAGKVIARFTLTVKSQQGNFRRDMSGQWITLTAPLEYTPKGVSHLMVTCEGEAVDIYWLQFKNRPKYFSAVPSAASPCQPDAQGFIRRWMLLEPIKQDIRSNVIFTDTWLRETFSKTYFKDQLTMLPRDGQKVKALGQTLAWHRLDSENYNVKLFRFAEKWGQQTYGSLFWAVTVIDCPETIQHVRLAAGSNGASIWWLNGEEALLLSGDRRMVEDDGTSPLITLQQGRNILRCAVINGPGLSDFCVRFVDEKGNPITNYQIQ